MKKQKETPGTIFKVQFNVNYHTYGRILNNHDFAFYDCKTKEDIQDLKSIIASEILFSTFVDSYAIKKHIWPIIGFLPLENNLTRSPLYYLPDVSDPNYHRIFDNGEIREASKEECIGLEVNAIWSPEQLEERINDHYNGVPNQHLTTLQKYAIK